MLLPRAMKNEALGKMQSLLVQNDRPWASDVQFAWQVWTLTPYRITSCFLSEKYAAGKAAPGQ